MSLLVCPLARNIVTASSLCAFTGKSMGSDTTSAPLGTENDGAPLKVMLRSVAGWIADVPEEPLKGRATVTAVMGRFVVPKALEKTRRIWEAGTETWTVWRIVELGNTRPVWFCESEGNESECRLKVTVDVSEGHTKGGLGKFAASVS